MDLRPELNPRLKTNMATVSATDTNIAIVSLPRDTIRAAVTPIRPCHMAAILSRETRKALFYHAKPRSGNHGGEAWRGKTKLFWSPRTIWPPCDKGELKGRIARL